MQNNVTELTQKLLGALDSNYNVIDMATIVEVIAILEKISITKELLETTRLGKHVNELRRNTQNESLAKRAKELVKKWRNNILPAVQENGQLEQQTQRANKRPRAGHQEHLALAAINVPSLAIASSKKQRVNGNSADYFSDSSNSSFKDLLVPNKHHSDSNSSMADACVIKQETVLNDEEQPRKRGRKKGSKNHKNLLDEAETSFSNKMAVSRGNAKVKTTQELVASLQSRATVGGSGSSVASSPSKNNIDDWTERAAKLTERVSLIDQKLNASSHRLKRKQQQQLLQQQQTVVNEDSAGRHRRHRKIDTDDDEDDEEIVVVDDEVSQSSNAAAAATAAEEPPPPDWTPSLSYEEAMSRLPPINRDLLLQEAEHCRCSCSIEQLEEEEALDESAAESSRVSIVEDEECAARLQQLQRCKLSEEEAEERVRRLHDECIDGVNGNYGAGTTDRPTPRCAPDPAAAPAFPSYGDDDVGVAARIVPNFYELPAKRKTACENYRKYCFTERNERKNEKEEDGIVKKEVVKGEAEDADDDDEGKEEVEEEATGEQDNAVGEVSCEGAGVDFSEYHQVVDRPSYNDELLRILPYVVID